MATLQNEETGETFEVVHFVSRDDVEQLKCCFARLVEPGVWEIAPEHQAWLDVLEESAST
jgi:hypothetical protein